MNKAQRELLESYFGEEGIYADAIINTKLIDEYTKIKYLNNAIEMIPSVYQVQLDLLFNPKESDEHQKNSLELIRSLKFINDCFHNNEVNYHPYGVRKCLDHHFLSLGPIDVEHFKKEITDLVRKIINLITSKDKTVLVQQEFDATFFRRQPVACSFWRQIPEQNTPSSQRIQEAKYTDCPVPEQYRVYENLWGIEGSSSIGNRRLGYTFGPNKVFVDYNQWNLEDYQIAEVVKVYKVSQEEIHESKLDLLGLEALSILYNHGLRLKHTAKLVNFIQINTPLENISFEHLDALVYLMTMKGKDNMNADDAVAEIEGLTKQQVELLAHGKTKKEILTMVEPTSSFCKKI